MVQKDIVRQHGLLLLEIAEAGDDEEAIDRYWREILATNLDGVYYVTRAALKHMPDEYGRIINISSVLGRFGVPGYAAYCTSKHGIIGFTRALALELAPKAEMLLRDPQRFVAEQANERRLARLQAGAETAAR